MNLLCESKTVIGIMISAYFIGFALGGFMYALPDKIGRRKSVLYALYLSCFAQTVMLLSQNFFVRTCMYFLMGLA